MYKFVDFERAFGLFNVLMAAKRWQITICAPHQYQTLLVYNKNSVTFKCPVIKATLRRQTLNPCVCIKSVRPHAALAKYYWISNFFINISNSFILPCILQCMQGSKIKTNYNLSTTYDVRLHSYYEHKSSDSKMLPPGGKLCNSKTLCVYWASMTTMWAMTKCHQKASTL